MNGHTKNAPVQPESGLEHFIIEGNHNPRNSSLVHSSPSQMDVIGNQQFDDFSFAYPGMPENGIQGAGKLEGPPDPYTISAQIPPGGHQIPPNAIHQPHRHSLSSASGDHRGSISSITRASFSGPVGQARNASVSVVSDEASPRSARAGGGLEGGYSDDFGLSNGGIVDGSDLGSRTREEKNDPNPPWSELKTKAGKERKRLPLACIACRRKKIRCSGEKPACKHCLRSRIPCVYKVTTRKAAPRTDYMAMLDKRLKRMEERIIKIVPKEEQDSTAASVVRATVKPAIPGTIPAKSSSGKKRPADEAFGPDLDNWSKSASKPNIDPNTRPTTLMLQEAEENKLLSEGADSLPSRELQEHLAEVFFENLYGQTYHLLHKPSFMRKLRAGTLPPVLILAVCAISARFSTHPKLNTTPNFLRGEEWASKARDIVIQRYEWPNITILTCLIILCLHEFGTCQGGRSWALGGQAIRMAYALQLHRDLDYDPQKRNGTVELSFIDREIRRRTMWSCFLMDRFNSSGTDRPTFIKEESIKVQLPIKEKYFQLDMPGPTEDLEGGVPHPVSPGVGELSDARDNMGVAAFMIKSIALWGRIIQLINLGDNERDRHPMWHPDSVYAKLVKQAEAFEEALPESLKYTPENLHAHETEGLANQFLFLHISIQQNILFMNRCGMSAQPREASTEVPKDFIAKAGLKAFEIAGRVSQILEAGESHFVTAPFTGYCAFLSSTVHIFGVFSKKPSLEVTSKTNLAINIKYLTKMKRYWGMFHFMAENLKDQYRGFADAARKGSLANGPNQTPTVFQYGDWFDRYPHGVSQSDYEDPLASVKKEKGDDAVLGEKSDLHTVEQFFGTLEGAPPPDGGAGRIPKRKATKKGQPVRQEQPEPINASLNASAGMQMQPTPHPVSHVYNQMSPTIPADMFNHPYYGHEMMLPPQGQGMLPQLDRQLVFGAYAGMDPNSLSTHSMIDGANNWDMQMGGMTGFTAEPTSAWFMPFNMEPPDLGHEQDIFNTMGGAYAMGGMPVNNNNNTNMGGQGN